MDMELADILGNFQEHTSRVPSKFLVFRCTDRYGSAGTIKSYLHQPTPFKALTLVRIIMVFPVLHLYCLRILIPRTGCKGEKMPLRTSLVLRPFTVK